MQLNVDPTQLDGWPPAIGVSGGGEERVATRVTTFAEIPSTGIGLLVDSYGLIALAVGQGSAAQELGLVESDRINLTPVSGRLPLNKRPLESPVVFTTNPGPEPEGSQ